MASLLDPIQIGDIDLPNRVIMAPLTRLRGTSDYTFGYVARELGKRKLAFLCAREYFGPDRLGPQLKKPFGGVYIANEKYDQALANQVIQDGEADAVAFGQLFIANPDLPARFANNAPLNTPEPTTYFTPGPHGYIDYPVLSASQDLMAR